MKPILSISMMIVALGLSAKPASADEEKTRQVIGGDILYSVQAWAPSESEALSQAESLAAHDLSVECSVAPKETKVYRQQITHLDGRVQANVQIGVSIEDCDAARNAPLERKASFANTALTDGMRIGPRQPVPHPAAPVAYRFTQAQLQSHERAIDQRVALREAERQKLKASIRY